MMHYRSNYANIDANKSREIIRFKEPIQTNDQTLRLNPETDNQIQKPNQETEDQIHRYESQSKYERIRNQRSNSEWTIKFKDGR